MGAPRGNTNGQRYSDAERAVMVDEYVSGRSYKTIAAEFGCAIGTVATAVANAGVAPRPRGAAVSIPPNQRWGKWTRSISTNGYVEWRAWDSFTQRPTAIAEHRLIMSWLLGRELRPGENVHHINGQRDDNRRENLDLWTSPQPSGINRCPHCGEHLLQPQLA